MSLDQEWKHVLDAVEVSLGSWVLVRSRGAGCHVGRLSAACGGTISLSDVTGLWSWEELEGRDNTGWLYDLADAALNGPVTNIRRSAKRDRHVIREVCDLTPMSEKQAMNLAGIA